MIPLSHLALDIPTPPLGWTAELSARGIPTVADDVGRECVTRATARLLLAEHREAEARKAALREETERRAVEADRAFRAALAPGIPAGAVPAGVSAGMLMMLSDPDRSKGRRQSVLEHSLENPGGAIVYTPLSGGES